MLAIRSSQEDTTSTCNASRSDHVNASQDESNSADRLPVVSPSSFLLCTSNSMRVVLIFLPLVCLTFLWSTSRQLLLFGTKSTSTSTSTSTTSTWEHVNASVFPAAINRASIITTKRDKKSSRTQTVLESILFPPPLPKQELQNHFPVWLVEYIKWHKEMRAQFPDDLLVLHPNRPQLLIKSCPNACGGLTDRMKFLSGYMYQAYSQQRVLLFKWYHPHYELESFLQPPLDHRNGDDDGDDGSFNWTLPIIHNITSTSEQLAAYALQSNGSTVVHHFREEKGSSPDPIPFARLWHTLFEPSVRLQYDIVQTFEGLQLTPHAYHALHLRVRHPAQYNRRRDIPMDLEGLNFTGSNKEYVIQTGRWAVHCIQNWTGGPTYLYSDSQDLVDYLVTTQEPQHDGNSSLFSTERQPRRQQQVLVARNNSWPNFHLDTKSPLPSTTNITNDDIWHSYASTFVDLYVAAFARCLGLGVGNFGYLAYMIGNHSCVVYYKKRRGSIMATTWGYKQIPGATECLEKY